jgi:hypothetical protein
MSAIHRRKTEPSRRDELLLLCLRFAWACQSCGCRVRMPPRVRERLRDDAATRQHIVPKCLGGGEGDNLTLYCSRCNHEDGRIISARLAGRHVTSLEASR